MANFNAEVTFTFPALVEASRGAFSGNTVFSAQPYVSTIMNARNAEIAFTFQRRYPTRVLPDVYDVLVWLCDDRPTLPTFPAVGGSIIKNTGAAGTTGDLTVAYGNQILGTSGLFGDSAGIPGTVTSGFHTSQDPSPTPASIEPPFPLTWSGWTLLRSNAVSNSSPVSKAYRPSTSGWSAPFNTTLFFVSGGTTNWQTVLIIGGSQQTLSSPRRFNVNVWHHVGWTYDGTTWILYQDGSAVASTALSGAVDYGTHGPYYIGGNFIDNDDRSAMIVQDVRIAKIVRPLSWWQQVYQQGYTLFGA